MKKISNKSKKNILIIAVSLLFVAVIGIFASFFAKDDLGKVKDKIDNFIEQEESTVGNNNFVKNSNFAINTSGVEVFDETTNTKVDSALLDDWTIYYYNDTCPEFTAYQVNDGFYVRNESDTYFQINQVIDEGVAKLGNKEITLTVSVDDVVYSVTSTLTSTEKVELTNLGDPNIYLAMFEQYGMCCLTLRFYTGVEATINWVKVELGSVFTGYNAPAVA